MKSYIDGTLQSVMQSQSQQGQDKRGAVGLKGRQKDEEAQRLKGRKSTESNGDQRLRVRAQRRTDKKNEGLWGQMKAAQDKWEWDVKD